MRSERAMSMFSKTKASSCRESSLSKLFEAEAADTDLENSSRENTNLSLGKKRSVGAPAKLLNCQDCGALYFNVSLIDF